MKKYKYLHCDFEPEHFSDERIVNFQAFSSSESFYFDRQTGLVTLLVETDDLRVRDDSNKLIDSDALPFRGKGYLKIRTASPVDEKTAAIALHDANTGGIANFIIPRGQLYKHSFDYRQ